jgi:hypothetical protein
MTSTEIVKKLRALALEIDNANPFSGAPAPKETRPAPAAVPGERVVEIEVGYWKIAETKTGKPMGSLSPAGDGERVYWKVFDEKLLHSFDPLQRGERLRVTLKPWNDTFTVTAITRLDRQVAAKGIDADEIPF